MTTFYDQDADECVCVHGVDYEDVCLDCALNPLADDTEDRRIANRRQLTLAANANDASVNRRSGVDRRSAGTERLGTYGDTANPVGDPTVHVLLDSAVRPVERTDTDRRTVTLSANAGDHGEMPDRRSTARRVADRSIIADQSETIRALEGQLALAKDKSGARLKMLELAIKAHADVEAQRDEAVRLLRRVHTTTISKWGTLWGIVEDFLNSLDAEEG